MARLKTALILLFSTSLISPFAAAQDPGTYRPGQPYAAVPALTSSICNTQCQGDAACRGWNFVRANPRQKTGVCEFNAVAVDPIQSPISVSANQTQVFNSTGQSRIISAGVRTTRIGTPSPAVPAQATNAQPQRNVPSTSRRQIVRQPVPVQTQPQATALRHNLEATSKPVNSQSLSIAEQLRSARASRNEATSPIARTSNGLPPRAPQAAYSQPQPQPQLQPQLQPQGFIPHHSQSDPRLQRELANLRRRQAQAALGANAPAPSVPASSGPHAQQAPRRGSLIQALTQSNTAAPTPQSPTQQYSALPTRSISVEEARQKSLYGHLNDDVQIPKPLTLEDLSVSDDQPIPTVSSVPVIPVDRSNFSGLAGG